MRWTTPAGIQTANMRWYEKSITIGCYSHDPFAGLDKLHFRMAMGEGGITGLQAAHMGDDRLRQRVDMRDGGGMRFRGN